jgi:hypothetical protein
VTAAAVTAGSIIKFGGYDWRVLEVKDGKALLLSDKVLGLRRYHNTWENVTWATSDIRAYLNGEFFNSFSATDRARIAQITNTNADNPWHGTPGGISTQDRIFLLSLDELVQYFGDADQLAKPEGEREQWWGFYGAHAGKRIAFCTSTCCNASSTVGHWWWLRSPGYESIGGSFRAAFIDNRGYVNVGGEGVSNVFGGVRPALWVYLDDTDPPDETPEPPHGDDINITVDSVIPGVLAVLTPGSDFPFTDTEKLTVKIEKKTPTNDEKNAFFTALKEFLT